MKRIFIIGAVAAAAVAVLIVGVALGIMVTPARAQVGQALNQIVNRATNGLQVVAAQAQSGPQVQLKAEKGILVAGVFQDSPADKAGLVRGDIILDVNGQAVNTYSDLSGALSQHKAGDTLTLTVQHGDTQKQVSVTLAEPPVATPSAQAAPQNGQPNNPNPHRGFLFSGPYLGIVPIGTGQFQFQQKGVQNGQPGARIVQVASGSPAEKAGLKVGEVIVSVNGTQVDAQNTLSALIGSHKPGDSVKLTVQGTDGNQRDVTVTLGDNPQKAGTAYLGVSTGGFGRGRGRGLGVPGFPGFPGGQNINPGNLPNLRQHPGALIQSVTANSPAEKAGLKAGQVIVSVDGKAVNGPQVLSDAVSGHKTGDQVTLSVYDPQSNKTSDVQVTLGDNPQKSGTAWLGISYGYFNIQNLPQPQQTPGTGGTNF